MKHIDGEFEYKGFKCQLACLCSPDTNTVLDCCCVIIHAHDNRLDRKHFTEYMLPHVYHARLFKDQQDIPTLVQADIDDYLKVHCTLQPSTPELTCLKADLLDGLSASEDKISPTLRALLKDLFYIVDKCLETGDAVAPNCFDSLLKVIHFINSTYSDECDRVSISILTRALQHPEKYDWTWED